MTFGEDTAYKIASLVNNETPQCPSVTIVLPISLDYTASSDNLSLGKSVTQSSTHSTAYQASCAVDGVENTDMDMGTCSHTRDDDGLYSWWMVDLGSSERVDNICITNRGDCCGTLGPSFFAYNCLNSRNLTTS